MTAAGSDGGGCPRWGRGKTGAGSSHVDAVLERDPDDVVLCEVRSNRRQALADLVRLVRLQSMESGEEDRSPVSS